MVDSRKWQGLLVCPKLAKLSAAEWRMRVLALPEEQQASVASIVFWDYADRSKEPAVYRKLFSRWLDMGIESDLSKGDLELGLRAVGYSALTISRRLPATFYERRNPKGRPRMGSRRSG